MYNIIVTEQFLKDIDYYKKKYRHIDKDIDKIVRRLEVGDLMGDIIPRLKFRR